MNGDSVQQKWPKREHNTEWFYRSKYRVLREIFSSEGVLVALQAASNWKLLEKNHSDISLAIEMGFELREEIASEQGEHTK